MASSRRFESFIGRLAVIAFASFINGCPGHDEAQRATTSDWESIKDVTCSARASLGAYTLTDVC